MAILCGVLYVLSFLCSLACASAIGANWGIQASHPLPPGIVVQMLKDNGIQKVKLFEADEAIMEALKKTSIQVMVGIPNDLLSGLAGNEKTAENWVSKNVSKFVNDGVDVRLSSLSISLDLLNFSVPFALVERLLHFLFVS
jgi:glucan endo-1,3-beta-glucosidase 5/6